MSEVLECKICGATGFARELDLARHLNEKHPTLAGDKALGQNTWNTQPRDTSQRVKGHKPNLDDYDKMSERN